MDQTLKTLTSSLKKILSKLDPQNNAISLIIMIGKENQGVSTLLKQSKFANLDLNCENNTSIYYNQNGVIVNLKESWINLEKNTLSTILKKINSCNRATKINGIILCVDINNLLTSDAQEIKKVLKSQTDFLANFGKRLPQITNLALLFTKLDLLSGFCEFFQNDYNLNLTNPLGFSVHNQEIQNQTRNNFASQYENFIESLNQQTINKIHPIRSSQKRTLIREFPLQLASLKNTIISLVKKINPTQFKLSAVYFTSGEQGGICVDRINKKIQNEFSLTLRTNQHQSINHRAYFITNSLEEFQQQTKQFTTKKSVKLKITSVCISSISILTISLIINNYYYSTKALDKVSKELITYDTLGKISDKKDLATYHLNKAYKTLNNISNNNITKPTIQKIKANIQKRINHKLSQDFVPSMLTDIENALASSKGHLDKYQALKVYLMLTDRNHQSPQEVKNWFKNYWLANYSTEQTKKKISLLNKVLKNKKTDIQINKQIITDARNYLNSLPLSYLYYSLIKAKFPQTNKSLTYDGFVISTDKIPDYLTKDGFNQIMRGLKEIVTRLQSENWVLARQDLQDLYILIQQAYCYEYVIFWQHFIQYSHPIHAQSFEDIYTLTKILKQNNIINNLVNLIQKNTSPITENNEESNLFNKEIASKFSDINLVSDSTIQQLSLTLNELEKFTKTMSVINDKGKTAFNLTKSRFQSDILANPISSLYNQSEQLPKPISSWAKQIADDTWFTLINNSRDYINYQWEQQILPEYKTKISDRYPFSTNATDEISIRDFNRFFAKNGSLNSFTQEYLKPFIDTSTSDWKLKELNSYIMPISKDVINELIRANVITNMFFAQNDETSQVNFSLQKINLDPIIANLQLKIGDIKMTNTQEIDDGRTEFTWPEANARLILRSIDGKQYELEELGTWGFFKILQKLNILVDERDSSNMQILFEINGNSGRYQLKAQNQVNPFIPGILDKFILPDVIV